MIKRITYIDSNIIEGQTDEVAEPAEIEAIGFVVEISSEYITIAREKMDKEWRGQLSIPIKSILEVKDL